MLFSLDLSFNKRLYEISGITEKDVEKKRIIRKLDVLIFLFCIIFIFLYGFFQFK